MQLQGIGPTFFAVPNGFQTSAAPTSVMRSTPVSSTTSASPNSIVIQNAMMSGHHHQTQVAAAPNRQIVQQQQIPVTTTPLTSSTDQNLLPPPKKKVKKKKRARKKDEEPPKLDLASIMKISGIGDDDDIFESDLAEPPAEVKQEQPSPAEVTTPQNNETQSSQLVTQLQTPVQNAISGHLRLSVGEDGMIVLQHQPEPNQPELNQITTQALIRSLTQPGGNNSQIISQLLEHAQIVQNTAKQRSKSPVTSNSNSDLQQQSFQEPIQKMPAGEICLLKS